MRTLMLVFALTVSMLAGCANMLIQEEDSLADKAGKVGARVFLGLTTLGISELVMADQREAWERARQLDAYRLELARLVEEGALTKADADKFHQIARSELERRAALHAQQRRWATAVVSASSPLGSQRSDQTMQAGLMPPQPHPTP